HGSVFFTAHRPNWNAYQPFFGIAGGEQRDNDFFDQFGGSVSGPIWKNKVFAFFNYETVREPAGTPLTGLEWFETSQFDSAAPAGSIAATYLSQAGNRPLGSMVNSATCATAGLTEGSDCVTIPGQGLDIGSPLTSGLGTQDLGWTSTGNPGVGNGL